MANLVTLNEYKDYVGIVSSEQDQKISNIIFYVSDLVKNYCGRNFIDTYNPGTKDFEVSVEYWNGGYSFYYTKEFPVHSISSLEYSADSGSTYTSLVSGTDYVIDKELDRVNIYNSGYYNGINSLKITYKGGYKDTPPSLKLAILDLIRYYMKQEDTPKKTTNSITMEYITSTDFPPHIKRVFDLFRVV